MGALLPVARSMASAPMGIPSKCTAGASTPPTLVPSSRAESMIFWQNVVFPHPGEPVINILMSSHHLYRRCPPADACPSSPARSQGTMSKVYIWKVHLS